MKSEKSPPTTPNLQKLLLVIISLGTLTWLLFRTNLSEVWSAILSANYVLIIFAGIPLMILTLVLRGRRWHLLLSPLGKPSQRLVFQSLTIGYLGNNLLPARAGEIIKVVLLNRKTGISFSSILATVVVERVIDGLFLSLIIVGMVFFFPTPIWLQQSIAAAGIIFFVFAGILLTMHRFRTAILDILTHKLGFISKQWRGRILPLWNEFTRGLGVLTNLKSVTKYGFVTIIIWLADFGFVWIVMRGFNIEESFLFAAFIATAAALSTSLPALPGSIGTYDFVITSLLILFSIPDWQATAFALSLHGLVWIVNNSAGVVSLFSLGLSPRTVVQEYKTTDQFPSS